jgi:hypothetical protein
MRAHTQTRIHARTSVGTQGSSASHDDHDYPDAEDVPTTPARYSTPVRPRGEPRRGATPRERAQRHDTRETTMHRKDGCVLCPLPCVARGAAGAARRHCWRSWRCPRPCPRWWRASRTRASARARCCGAPRSLLGDARALQAITGGGMAGATWTSACQAQACDVCPRTQERKTVERVKPKEHSVHFTLVS